MPNPNKFAPTSEYLAVQRECIFMLLQRDSNAYSLVYKNLMLGRKYNDLKTSEFTDWILNHRDVYISAEIYRLLEKEKDINDDILAMNKRDLEMWLMKDIDDLDLSGYEYPKSPSRFAFNPGGYCRWCLECFICMCYWCEKEKYNQISQSDVTY